MSLGLLTDKDFYKKLVAIALPIALQNLISSSLNMVDNVMIGKVGETQLASVSLANQIFFLYVLLLFGTNSGLAIFISQFWGKRDIINIRRVLGIALISGISVSFVFAGGAIFAPKFLMGIFIKNPEVIEFGSHYLRIVALSYTMTAITFAYSFSSRSIGRASFPMMVSAISLATNTLLNYLLIFGNFGFPELGIRGAAIATLISRTVEMFLLVGTIYRKNTVLNAKIKDLLDLDRAFIGRIFKTALPVILNEAFWSLGMTMYVIAYARIGEKATAAVQIANTVYNIFFVVGMGLANACAVMIGNRLGEGQRDAAILYARRFSILGPLSGVFLGSVLYFTAPMVVGFFSGVSDETMTYAIKILTIMAFIAPVRLYTTILIVGILRGGGDTKFSLYLESGSVWGIGVPLAFIGALVLHLPVYWVYALVTIEEVVKALIGIPRVVSNKWAKNVVEHM